LVRNLLGKKEIWPIQYLMPSGAYLHFNPSGHREKRFNPKNLRPIVPGRCRDWEKLLEGDHTRAGIDKQCVSAKKKAKKR